MEQRKVEQVAEFHPGTKLGLTPEQVKHRERRLKSLGDGVYEVLESVQFKVGEVIGVETLNRAQELLFVAPEAPQVEAEKAPEPQKARRRRA